MRAWQKAFGALLLAAFAGAAFPGEGSLKTVLEHPEFGRELALKWRELPQLLDDPEMPDCAADFRANNFTLYQLLDASAKDAPGLLVGAWTHLGNWDECVDIRDVPGSKGAFHGQMCLLTIGASGAAGAALEERQRAEALARAEGIVSRALLDSVTLKMAACVPSTCSPDDVQIIFSKLLESPLSNLGMGVSVNPINCATKEKDDFDAVDWVALAIYLVLGLAVICSTAVDVLLPKRAPVLAAFSVYTNGKKLLSLSGGGDGTISCLHGIRFASMAWVVMGHRYYLYLSIPSINPLYMKDFYDDWTRIAMTNATVSVDTFFVLSGLLVGYLFFKQMRVSRKFNLPMYYIHRYIRLTPALAFMILMNSSLLGRMSWGPLWKSIMMPSRDNCQKSWWNVLLYVNNYVMPNEGCIGQSWYLMVDMQLYWLSPLLLFPMLYWPRIGFGVFSLLCAGGLASNFALSYVYELPGNFLANREDKATMAIFQRHFYIPAYSRFVPYLVGLALGYVLADVRVKNTKVRLSMGVTLLLWLCVAALLLVPLFCGYAFLHGEPPTRLATAFYNMLNRPAWAAGVAMVVFLCATGHGCCVNTLLSWKGFQLLSRLSYCVFLVHISVQNVEGASLRTVPFMADITILPEFASDMLIAYLIAAVLSLVTESPFMVLEKELLGRGRAHKPAANGVANGATNGAPALPPGKDPKKDERSRV